MRIRNHPAVARVAFTLTEMLIVVAIIVVIAGIGGTILLPRLDAAREDADRVKAAEISAAATQFMANSDGQVPTAEQLTQSDGSQGGRPLLQLEQVHDRHGQPFDIREASNGGVVVQSRTPGKDGQYIGNWKKGTPPPQ